MFKNIAKIKKVIHPDDWWTEWFVRPFSIRLVSLIQDTRISPNNVTLASCVIVLVSCGCILIGNHFGYVLAAIGIYTGYVLDVADGILARYKKQFSPFGGWFDGISDRIKEFFILFCLALQLKPVGMGTVFLGMYALLLLAMYHGYISKNIPVARKPATMIKKAGRLTLLNMLRHKVKFGFFNLGEQMFLYTLFLLINKVEIFFIVFTVYGTLALTVYSFLKFKEYYAQDSA